MRGVVSLIERLSDDGGSWFGASDTRIAEARSRFGALPADYLDYVSSMGGPSEPWHAFLEADFSLNGVLDHLDELELAPPAGVIPLGVDQANGGMDWFLKDTCVVRASLRPGPALVGTIEIYPDLGEMLTHLVFLRYRLTQLPNVSTWIPAPHADWDESQRGTRWDRLRHVADNQALTLVAGTGGYAAAFDGDGVAISAYQPPQKGIFLHVGCAESDTAEVWKLICSRLALVEVR